MRKISPQSWFESESRLQHLAGCVSSPTLELNWAVLLCDTLACRRQVVSQIISECGVQPLCIDALSALVQAEFSPRCNLAIVALGGCPSPADSGLEGIRSLRRKGFNVICYAEDAQSWPLSIRCQVLLAGTWWLLDSAKPEFGQKLRHILMQALGAQATRHAAEERARRVLKQLGSVGESLAITTVFQTVLRVSTLSDLPILITGETGTGKELLARAIHSLDLKRHHGPFIALNCGAISPGLAESELFGHRRGAFTGADRDRKGLIRSAEGGILFLDEIGELDLSLQAKLLRVLQESRVLGVGGDRESPINVRIIAATNRNLNAMVDEGAFRADLLHRLHVLAIHIPPLRERLADLKPLIEHFLKKYQFLKPGWPLEADAEFIEALAQLELPGNARQLENIVRWALVHKDDDAPLTLNDLPPEVWQQLAEQGKHSHSLSPAVGHTQEGQQSAPGTPPQAPLDYMVKLLDLNGWNLSRSLQHCERLLLEVALRKTHGNQSQTARLLGITPRSVYNKVHKHHLHP